MSFARIEQGV